MGFVGVLACRVLSFGFGGDSVLLRRFQGAVLEILRILRYLALGAWGLGFRVFQELIL